MAQLAQPLEPPARLARRRSDGTEGRLSRDRLTTMLVLAALLHGLVILGLSFTAPGPAASDVDRGMEVLLVSDELAEAQKNDSATYLAQRTQVGSGNSNERLPARLPTEAGQQPQAAVEGSRPTERLEDQVLTTTRPSLSRIQLLPLPETPSEPVPQTVAKVEEAPPQAGDQELRLRGEARDELYITADTRATRLAPYLDSWRRRVERIGTLNYPQAARARGLSGSPVIEVAIERDGRLKSARIQRSSGHPEIDAAALEILKQASPFDPFPPELAQEYKSLRFAYEWQFEGGLPVESAISVP
jgi:protein TonB